MKAGHSPMPSRTVMNAVWLFLLGAICLQILVQLVHVSMFFDGGIYATLARNLAEGRGSMWAPYLSDTLFPTFAEHPPLMFWLQAIGFQLFGDSIAVEKGFSFLTFILCALLLFQIWKRLNKDDVLVQAGFPFALMLALIAGRVNWGFANGLLDNLLAVFTLTAVLLLVVAYDRPAPIASVRRLALVSAAGLAICMSLMTKGPVGLFPLAVPAIDWLVFRRQSFLAMVIDSLVIALVIGLFLGLLYAFDPSREALGRYVSAQLVSSLSGARGHYGGGLYVFRKILGVNGYSLAILAAAAFAAWRWKLGKNAPEKTRTRLKRAAFLILVGMSASLPIGLSPRVANFYFNTSLLLYSAGFAILVAPVFMDGLSRLREHQSKFLGFGSLLFFVASILLVVANIGRPGADARTIEQAALIEEFVCSDETNCRPLISACQNAWQDWALHTYMQRFYKISIAKQADVDADFVIADETCSSLPGHKDTGIDISPYLLLERG
ncbi:glycosyltransferase family 39 protein (plasmid) [Peteryoungia desertarenae]|uniref:Glycosyltransferase family 39 protein n=1 Tax=Peteryoungia desertarenae TaxID=1813451 RepID=A0ABX6QT07_9HYPH|nr:glycosyltransferase family 39 protein [Peteryoungia desertarenae]QLF71719.1 glycosyltransferase family 39 protein [Peteryoungia desertarenae]